jgi:hypothetical protein
MKGFTLQFEMVFWAECPRTPTIFRTTPKRLAKGGGQAARRIAASIGGFDQRLLPAAIAQSGSLVSSAAIQGR